MSKPLKFLFSFLIVLLIFETLTRIILFIPTNIDVFKYGFKKSVIFEIVDLSKLQIHITDKERKFKKNKYKKIKSKSNFKKVWIFGGSTTFGYNCNSDQVSSWPREIYNIDQNFDYLNFAFNGANTDQSIVLLSKKILKYQPQIILWAHKFNILNVIGKKNYRNEEILKYKFSKSKENNFFLKIKRLDKSLKSYLLFYSFLDKIFERILDNLYQKDIIKKFEIKPTNEDIKYATKNFEINTIEAIELSKKMKVKEFYLISLFSKSDFVPSEKTLKYKLYEETIKSIEKSYFPYARIIDVNTEFKNYDYNSLLCDGVHQTLKGNKLQAEIIYKNLTLKTNLLK